MIRREKAEYELPVEGVAWTRGAGHPAGIFFLDGRCHFVALGSPAEALLAERGAVHVANVAFDRPTLERTHRDRSVRLVSSVDAARWTRPDTAPGPHGQKVTARTPVR